MGGEPIGVKDIVAPPSVEINQGYVKLGERMTKTFFVFSFPRYLSTAWMSPIVNIDTPLDISIFTYPADVSETLKKLRKRVTEVQSEIMDREESGKIRDPELETAYEDLEELRDRLQTAQEKMFHVGVYISVYGDSEEELGKVENQLRSMLESRLIYVKPALFQQREGFVTTSPYGLDWLKVYTPMNTAPLSSMFPFISFDLSSNEGILYGINKHNNSLVLFDRFTMENAGLVVFGKAGGGKTLRHDEPVLVNTSGGTSLTPIGKLVEQAAEEHGTRQIDREIEGIPNPPDLKVWSFDKEGRGCWTPVTMAMRKKAPQTYYRVRTRSGREITTTGDHNMVMLNNGYIEEAKTENIKEGSFIPLTRRIHNEGEDNKPVVPATHAPNTSFPITDELLRIAGLYTAEGSLETNKICITNQDLSVQETLIEDFEQLALPWTFRIDKRTGQRKGIFGHGEACLNTFIHYDGASRAEYKRVWSFIYDLGNQQIAQYLAAYFEGDGGVETWKQKTLVTASSKSRDLLSDISYLLYFFGIIARLRKTEKKSQNWSDEEKQPYWVLTISGREQLKTFYDEIGFLTDKKNKKLAEALERNVDGNTNVDTIPTIAKPVREMYEAFPPLFWGIPEISEWKNGKRTPSPQHLEVVLNELWQRAQAFRDKATTYKVLGELPELNDLISTADNDRELNRQLWQELGQSWREVKHEGARPGWRNASKILETVQGESYELHDIKQRVYIGFHDMTLDVKNYNRTLQSALVDRPETDTRYDILQRAARHVWQNYQDVIENKLPFIEQKLADLKALATADLYWDEIVEIEQIENTEDEYVYDLTVDNEVFLAGTGGMFVHNSYAVKLEILRSMMMGTDAIIVDPENEYEFLADAVGGSFLNISLGSENRINPFDLPQPRENENPEDVLRSNIINLVGLLRIMLGGLSAEEDAILDRALTETYAIKDITPDTDPKYWPERIPLFSDLESILETMEGAESLRRRLSKFTRGTYANFFNQHTNIAIDKQLVIFGIRDMEESLREMAMYIVMRYIWNQVRTELKKRIMVIDEAWWLMQTEDGASFLYGLAKRGRKYYLGVTTVTQDVIDFMKSDYGKPIITNSSLQLLMKQSTAAADILIDTFDLTDSEKNLLIDAPVGEGLFFAGQKHVNIRVVSSYAEDQIITTAPEEVKKIKEEKKRLKGEK